MRRGLCFALLAAVVGLAARSLAQAGPPLISDDPGTPGNRHWEINIGVTAEQSEHETGWETPLLDINYGAGDHVQLKLEIPYVLQTSNSAVRSGLGNTKIGVKWRFLDGNARRPAISIYPQFTFNNPTHSVRRGLADDGWQMFLPIEASKRLGKFQIDGEAGYNIQQRFPNEVWLGLVGAFSAHQRMELLAELHSIASHRFSENESVFDLGARIRMTRLSTFLFAAGRALPGSTSDQPRFFMYSGVQFTF